MSCHTCFLELHLSCSQSPQSPFSQKFWNSQIWIFKIFSNAQKQLPGQKRCLWTHQPLDLPRCKAVWSFRFLRSPVYVIEVTSVINLTQGGGELEVCLWLRGYWVLPTEHKGNTPARDVFPAGGWVSCASLPRYSPTRQQGFWALLAGGWVAQASRATHPPASRAPDPCWPVGEWREQTAFSFQ